VCAPNGERGEDDGVGGVGGGGEDIGDGVFHGAAHVFVVTFRVCDVSALPSVWALLLLGEKMTSS
jgi:hypothetical protein